MTPVIVLTTVGESFDARPLARDLVERRLCACINILPRVDSVYAWEGKVVDDAEQLLVIKTVEERLEELRDALFTQHPYDVPEFVVLRIDDLSDGYRAWLTGSVAL